MNNRRNQGGEGRGPSTPTKSYGRGGSDRSGPRQQRDTTSESSSHGGRAGSNRPSRGAKPASTRSGFNRDDNYGNRIAADRPVRRGPARTRDEQPSRGGFGKRAAEGRPSKSEVPNVRIVSDLQITDGRLKGKYLKTSDSKRGRIIPRKLREGILRTVIRRIKGKRFLDLSGGCGMIGIEAVSRGAVVATMVERSARLRSLIAKNMEACEVKEGHGEVSDLEAVPFLQRMAKRRRRWDLVFVDAGIEADAMDIVRSLGRSKIVDEGGGVVVCHPTAVEMPESAGSLTRWRLYSQDEDSVSYYERVSR